MEIAHDCIFREIVQKKGWERSQNLHKLKLKEIELSNNKRIDNTVPNSFKPSFHKDKAKEFYRREKLIDIERSNEKLLNRLIDISTGKNAHGKLAPLPRNSSSLKFTQFGSKKKLVSKINHENVVLATKIVKTNSHYSVLKYLDDYEKSRKYEKIRSKPQLQPDFKKKLTSINSTPNRSMTRKCFDVPMIQKAMSYSALNSVKNA